MVPMVLTVLEARVAPERADELQAAYRGLASRLPLGLVRSDLLRAVDDPTLWRVHSLWESREALDAMRAKGTPSGVLMFRAVGAEPVLTIFRVAEQLVPRG